MREEGLVVHKGAETGRRIHTDCHITMVKRTELGTKHQQGVTEVITFFALDNGRQSVRRYGLSKNKDKLAVTSVANETPMAGEGSVVDWGWRWLGIAFKDWQV